MNLRECYEKMEADYESTLGRLIKEDRIRKYVLCFIDTDECKDIKQYAEAKDWEAVFRVAHTIKGVSMNLGFTKLEKSSSILCDELRGIKSGSEKTGTEDLIEKLKSDYYETTDLIKQYEQEMDEI